MSYRLIRKKFRCHHCKSNFTKLVQEEDENVNCSTCGKLGHEDERQELKEHSNQRKDSKRLNTDNGSYRIVFNKETQKHYHNRTNLRDKDTKNVFGDANFNTESTIQASQTQKSSEVRRENSSQQPTSQVTRTDISNEESKNSQVDGQRINESTGQSSTQRFQTSTRVQMEVNTERRSANRQNSARISPSTQTNTTQQPQQQNSRSQSQNSRTQQNQQQSAFQQSINNFHQSANRMSGRFFSSGDGFFQVIEFPPVHINFNSTLPNSATRSFSQTTTHNLNSNNPFSPHHNHVFEHIERDIGDIFSDFNVAFPQFNPIFSMISPNMFMHNFNSNFTSDSDFMEIIRRISEQEAEAQARKKRAKQDAVKKLPIITIETQHCKKSTSGELEPPSCTICCEVISIGLKGMFMPCGHIYHEECLNPWLKERNTCPVCRYELPTEEQ